MNTLCAGRSSWAAQVSPGIKMLEKSTEIDPNYALAWAYLGASYTSDAAFEFGGREQSKTCPLLDGLRNEPEFDPLLNVAQQRYETFKTKFF
jgi:hypothetical protein